MIEPLVVFYLAAGINVAVVLLWGLTRSRAADGASRPAAGPSEEPVRAVRDPSRETLPRGEVRLADDMRRFRQRPSGGSASASRGVDDDELASFVREIAASSDRRPTPSRIEAELVRRGVSVPRNRLLRAMWEQGCMPLRLARTQHQRHEAVA